MADIGKNIKFYRALNDMTMDELGKAIDVQKQTIQKYEAGKIASIPPEKIHRMAEVFKVEPRDLTDINAIDVFKKGQESFSVEPVLSPTGQKYTIHSIRQLQGLQKRKRARRHKNHSTEIQVGLDVLRDAILKEQQRTTRRSSSSDHRQEKGIILLKK